MTERVATMGVEDMDPESVDLAYVDPETVELETVDLDDMDALSGIDPVDALGDVEAAAQQWADARARSEGVLAPLDLVDQVVVCGMGGSGIVADVVQAVAAPGYDLPVFTHKGPGLPAWVGGSTLVVAVSYSGNTSETLDATRVALERGAPVIGITSGGQLAELLDDADQTVVDVPGGGQPRHSTGSLLVPVLVALELDRDLDAAIDRLGAIAERNRRDVPTVDNTAKQLAVRLAAADAGIPALYGTRGIGEVAAYRMRCQLAENAEMRSTHHGLPELCHNEVVAWADTATAGAVLWLAEDPAEQRRIDVLRDLFADRFAWEEQITAEGDGPLERFASLTGLLDLASVYTAIARRIDPTPVDPITEMKEALA